MNSAAASCCIISRITLKPMRMRILRLILLSNIVDIRYIEYIDIAPTGIWICTRKNMKEKSAESCLSSLDCFDSLSRGLQSSMRDMHVAECTYTHMMTRMTLQSLAASV